ncbi:hypothetical protein F0562_021617 [Nyssa sinensis]|uniref:Uncharacterized protein n=1 Tax=Nyssa sinensis TaxID=561372 RepID=A0A5J5BPC0_9ASTE|nr:hypothetical protein F0562_021617 [Nyssa sinensis]
MGTTRVLSIQSSSELTRASASRGGKNMPPDVAKTCFQRWQSQASRASIASKDGRAKTSEVGLQRYASRGKPSEVALPSAMDFGTRKRTKEGDRDRAVSCDDKIYERDCKNLSGDFYGADPYRSIEGLSMRIVAIHISLSAISTTDQALDRSARTIAQADASMKSDATSQNIMVHPSDVLGPSVPGPIVLLVDCPTPSHLQELLSVQSLSSYYADMHGNPVDSCKTVNCIIHLTPAAIINTSDYQKWMTRFGAAQHIMAGHESSSELIRARASRGGKNMPPDVAKTCFQRWQSQASRASIASKDGRAKTSEVGLQRYASRGKPSEVALPR